MHVSQINWIIIGMSALLVAFYLCLIIWLSECLQDPRTRERIRRNLDRFWRWLDGEDE
jgi:hypothetical protein